MAKDPTTNAARGNVMAARESGLPTDNEQKATLDRWREEFYEDCREMLDEMFFRELRGMKARRKGE